MLNFILKIFWKLKRYHFLLISLHLFYLSLIGQDSTYVLNGLLLNAENSEVVPNAVIQLIGTNNYATSRKDGTFEIGPVTTKKFRLKVTHLSFQESLVDLDTSKLVQKRIVIYLFPRTITLNPIIVADNVIILDANSEYNQELKGKILHQKLGQTVGHTLKNEIGIAVRSMGPAPSRPVYRGLGQDRILIAEDGIKTNDLSATSPDHAVTVEPFTAERIEILRGPKVLMKASSTIGGLVNIVREEIPKQLHNSAHYTLGGYFESANLGRLLTFKTEIPLKIVQSRFEISKRVADDITTTIGKLKNSSSQNLSISSGLSYIKNGGYLGSALKVFELNYGIPGGFVGAHPFGVNIQLFKRQLNLETSWKLNNEKNVKANYSLTYYRHKELEYSGRIGSEYRIVTNSICASYALPEFSIFHHGLFGLDINHRDYSVGGYVFTPKSQSLNISAFAFQGLTRNKFDLDFAARLSYDVIKPLREKFSKRIGWIRKKEFWSFSFSAAAIYQFSEILYIGGNLSRSSRSPTIEELFSEGPHLAAYSFEVGNPDLNLEQGWGSELFIHHKFDKFNFTINAFYNDLNSYIVPRNTGTINYQTFLPVYATSNEDVRLYGVESSIFLNLYKTLKLNLTFSHTIGEIKLNNKPLPQIPPAKGIVELNYINENLTTGFSIEWAMSQKRVDEFEEPTAGYGIVNYHFQYQFYIKKLINNFSINLDNILNKEYRNHLSRIKSIFPEAGRNLRIIYKVMI